MKTLSFWQGLAWCVLLVAAGLSVYRAKTQTIAHDEALTYEWFLDQGIENVLRYNTTNHILQTLLAKPTVKLLGVSEFTFRLPTLAGAGIYLVSVYLLCRRLFGNGLVLLLSLAMLAWNPLVRDFMVAARGFGLGLAFLMLAMYFIAELTESGEFDKCFSRILFDPRFRIGGTRFPGRHAPPGRSPRQGFCKIFHCSRPCCGAVSSLALFDPDAAGAVSNCVDERDCCVARYLHGLFSRQVDGGHLLAKSGRDGPAGRKLAGPCSRSRGVRTNAAALLFRCSRSGTGVAHDGIQGKPYPADVGFWRNGHWLRASDHIPARTSQYELSLQPLLPMGHSAFYSQRSAGDTRNLCANLIPHR